MKSRSSLSLIAAVLLALIGTPPSPAAANRCRDGGALQPDDSGIGGTGATAAAPENEGGIGGTARVEPGGDDEGGVGGTGIAGAGDTGIIGTITGFASICVGGVEIHYRGDTPVQIDGQTATAAQLRVGQVVEVIADGAGEEVHARQIALHHLVSGPLSGVEPELKQIQILAQTIQLTGSTRFGAHSGEAEIDLSTLQQGEPLKVSGLRRGDGVIVATYLSRAAEGDPVRLTGKADRNHPLTVAGVPVRTHLGRTLLVGDEVRLSGVWDGTGIVAASIESVPRIPFGGRVNRIDFEGYASGSAASGHIQIGSFAVTFPKEAAITSPAGETRVRLQGIVRREQIIAERLSIIGDFRPPHDPGAENRPPKNGPPGKDHPAQPAPAGIPDHPGGNGRPLGNNHPEQPRPPGAERGAPPDRPDLPVPPPRVDRPAPPAGRIDRPPAPDRPPPPQRPDRGERPPPRSDRPERPPIKPDLPGRAASR